MRSCTDSELAPEGQAQTASPNESESRDLELGAGLYWCALKHRTIEPDPSSIEYAQAAMEALVAGKDPAFLRKSSSSSLISSLRAKNETASTSTPAALD
jgi:hypothetical protein